ncbi:MAG: type II and III secretion system protein, partial [Bacteroidota bacterium]
DFYLQLRAQESQGNLKVRMEPVLSMLNGREASLTIGQTQYFLLETTTSTSGAVNNFQQFTQRFDRIDANITLTLKPYISDNGIVTLDVLPDFTTPVGSFSADVPPTIATRRFVSTIRVKEGETVVLGGLNEEAITENREGIPWISRVPVLKWFTGNVQRTNLQSSLLIYITPTIYYN